MTHRKIPKIRFHGVRGSRPVHHTGFLGYGGNTTCLELESGDDFTLVIDAGTGLQKIINNLLQKPHKKKMHILLTHTHWDHIIHLPLLPQFNQPDFQITIHAPNVGETSFETLFSKMVAIGRLPVPWAPPKCRLTFQRVVPGESFLIENKVKVTSYQVNHQHVTLGYKFGFSDSSIAIITDTAVMRSDTILGQDMLENAQRIGVESFINQYHEGLVEFLHGVDSLVFDTHFNEKNVRPDWGHSTPELALEFCIKSEVKRLFLFHHAPEDNDHAVAKKQSHTRQLALPHGIEVLNAREEDEWPLLSA
jgi:phosphoribosyl 1,2-cyclic phosphodiesterase